MSAAVVCGKGRIIIGTAAEELRLQYEQMKGSGFPLNMVLDFGKSSVYTFRLSTTAIKKPLREWSARQFHLLLPKDLESRLKSTIVKLFIDFGID